MSKKIRHILAVSLLLVFVTPTTVKLLDEAFHHHVYFPLNGKSDEVVHVYHSTCPIPGFTLSFYTAQNPVHVIEKQIYLGEVVVIFPKEHFSSELNSSALLRAPPLSDKLL